MNIELQQRLMTKATSLIELIEYMIKLLARLNIFMGEKLDAAK